MQRKEWTVGYTTTALWHAAEAKRQHHEAREEHYAAAVENVVAEIKERGIIIESRPDKRFGAASSYYEPHGRIDPELDQKLGEAQSKLSEHRTKRIEYDRWTRMLAQDSAPEGFDLDIDDLEFFGL